MATCQNEKNNFTQCVFLQLPFIVLISTEIVRQRRWRRLATEQAGVDKLPDYLWSDTRDVKKLDSGHYISNGHYWKILNHRKSGRKKKRKENLLYSVQLCSVLLQYNVTFYLIFN